MNCSSGCCATHMVFALRQLNRYHAVSAPSVTWKIYGNAKSGMLGASASLYGATQRNLHALTRKGQLLVPGPVTKQGASDPFRALKQLSRLSMSSQPAHSHCLDDNSVETFCIPGAKVFERFFECPLDYHNESGEKIAVFVRHLVPIQKVNQFKTLPFLLYLQGGPGFECALPGSAKSGWIKAAFDHGYQVIMLDQRGTGLSTPVSAQSLAKFKTDEEKLNYLTHFRADSIVRDCEVIRKQLTAGREQDDQRLTLLGQSFGGFCCTTYLSLFPESLRQVFITGGVPPLVDTPDAVYQALYPRIMKRNAIYYEKFPRDVDRVRDIVKHLSEHKVLLPNGGVLSPRRFLQLGLAFGGSGGYDRVHEAVVLAARDLSSESRSLSYHTLNHIQQLQSFDSNVIYAILHEAIYCQNEQPSRWAAQRMLSTEPFASAFEWRTERLAPDQKVLFTGETIYPFMLDDYSELQPLKNVANLLAEYTGWGNLYHEEILQKNEVPAAGVSYYDDMYVDLELSNKTASKIKGFKQWITNEYAHNGLREDGDRVFNYLAGLVAGDAEYHR